MSSIRESYFHSSNPGEPPALLSCAVTQLCTSYSISLSFCLSFSLHSSDSLFVVLLPVCLPFIVSRLSRHSALPPSREFRGHPSHGYPKFGPHPRLLHGLKPSTCTIIIALESLRIKGGREAANTLRFNQRRILCARPPSHWGEY